MSHFAAEVTKKERPPLSSSGFPQEILPKREILLMLYIDSAHVLISTETGKSGSVQF
jgi:hypothetical protein